MEPEGSLTHSQEPSIGPFPEPDQSSPSQPIPSHLSKISLILSTHLRLGLPSVIFLSVFLTNNLYAFLFSPFVLHTQLISPSFTWSLYLYLAKNTSYYAARYAVFFTLPSLQTSSVQIFSSATFSQMPSVYVASLMPETKYMLVGVPCHLNIARPVVADGESLQLYFE
jgi:hypothetical protein